MKIRCNKALTYTPYRTVKDLSLFFKFPNHRKRYFILSKFKPKPSSSWLTDMWGDCIFIYPYYDPHPFHDILPILKVVGSKYNFQDTIKKLYKEALYKALGEEMVHDLFKEYTWDKIYIPQYTLIHIELTDLLKIIYKRYKRSVNAERLEKIIDLLDKERSSTKPIGIRIDFLVNHISNFWLQSMEAKNYIAHYFDSHVYYQMVITDLFDALEFLRQCMYATFDSHYKSDIDSVINIMKKEIKRFVSRIKVNSISELFEEIKNATDTVKGIIGMFRYENRLVYEAKEKFQDYVMTAEDIRKILCLTKKMYVDFNKNPEPYRLYIKGVLDGDRIIIRDTNVSTMYNDGDFKYSVRVKNSVCVKYMEYFVKNILFSGKIFGNSFEGFKEIVKNKEITEAFKNSKEYKTLIKKLYYVYKYDFKYTEYDKYSVVGFGGFIARTKDLEILAFYYNYRTGAFNIAIEDYFLKEFLSIFVENDVVDYFFKIFRAKLCRCLYE